MARLGQFRRDTMANWKKENPIIADGEFILIANDSNNPHSYDYWACGDGTTEFINLKFKEVKDGTGVLGITDELSELSGLALSSRGAKKAIDEVGSISYFAKRGSTINISTNYSTTNTAEILTLSQAINKVPPKDRVLRFQGTYLASDGWHTIIYTGDDISTWANSTKWIDFTDSVFNNIFDNATLSKFINTKVYTDSYDANRIIRKLFIDISNYNGSYVLDKNHLYIKIIAKNVSGLWGIQLGNAEKNTIANYWTDKQEEIISSTNNDIYLYAELNYDNMDYGSLSGSPFAITNEAFNLASDPRKSITSEKIADNAVTKDKIATAAVTFEKLQYNAVTTEIIDDYAVTTDKIYDGAVTKDKLSPEILEENMVERITEEEITEIVGG